METSSFKEVLDSNPYKKQKNMLKKTECVGHVQKRLGTRLRKICKTYRRKKENNEERKGSGKDYQAVWKGETH